MAARLAGLLPRLNERDRRLALATEAKSWGNATKFGRLTWSNSWRRVGSVQGRAKPCGLGEGDLMSRTVLAALRRNDTPAETRSGARRLQ